MNALYTGKFIFRTPLLPFSTKKMSDDELLEISKQQFFKEAIYLASPVLHDELLKWHTGEMTDQKEIGKLKISLSKYYSRMQSRCTPYGLFAACSVGSWGTKNEFIILNSISRHTRLDMNYLCALAQYLCQHPALMPHLKFYPNNSIYTSGNSIRYIEYRYINNRRSHQISSIENSTYIQTILMQAAKGEKMEMLAQSIVEEDITTEDAHNFLHELIANQLLTSELEPAITGAEFIHQLLTILGQTEASTNDEELKTIVTALAAIRDEINNIDKSVTNETQRYRNIYEQLKTLGVKTEENQLFQTDSYKNTISATLDSSIQQGLSGAINFLNKLSHTTENALLKKFKENFYNQYEDAEVPLLEALDTETGVGYKGKDTTGINQLLDDIFITDNRKQGLNLVWNEQQDFLHQRLTAATQQQQYAVEFTDDDVKHLDYYTESIPDSLSVMFRMVGDKKIYLQSCGGSSGANFLGRFAHGDDAIRELIMEITDYEQRANPDKIVAEIIHLPESRIGNILLRPIFRQYEIPYLGKSSLPEEQQLSLQDLYVSVRNNKIMLRSKKLDKEIIPRLTTAHNYSHNALPVYQFLCDLQTQYFEKSQFGFHWGALSNRQTFLPRATYKNIILERAKWQLKKEHFEELLKEKIISAETLKGWRKHWKMPSLMLLSDGDNELFINFDDEMSLRMFISTIRKRTEINLEEFLFDTEQFLVKDEHGQGYTNEFIAVLLNQKAVTAAANNNYALKNDIVKTPAIQRDFSIGSEWLYFKFYCGIKTLDKILCETVKPLTEEITAKGLADKFFFIRFVDPDHHLRLRFHLNDKKNMGELIALVHLHFSEYLEQGLITKIQADTYKRELERYGATTMELTESVFHTDSISTLNVLNLLDLEQGEQIKWQFAIKSIDDLLAGMQFEISARMALLEVLKNNFVNEHGGSKELKIQLDTKFRNTRKNIESVMNPAAASQSGMQEIFDLLEIKKQQLQPLLDVLVTRNKNNQLQVNIYDLAGSYIHMMLNRIFRSRQRTYEMLIYDLLYKYYKSETARNKNKEKTNALQIL